MYNIWDILDEYMIRDNLINDQRWVNLYPSEASVVTTNKWNEQEVHGTCQRRAWLRFKVAEKLNESLDADVVVLDINGNKIAVAPEAKEARREWIFEEGRRIESTILDVARSAGIYAVGHKKFLVPIAKDLNLVGELDGILSVNGNLIGVEIKSVSGYNSERDIFGTAAVRRNNVKGSPKMQHLLQTAIYAWHYRAKIPCFKILYFMRGNCLRTEFTVTVKHDTSTDDYHVLVDGSFTGITIGDIINRYKELADKLNKNEFPDREFQLSYTDSEMVVLSERGLLSKTTNEQWQKYWERKQTGGRQVKRPQHGDMECSLCPFKDVCYDRNGAPIEYDSVLHANISSQTNLHESDELNSN